MGPRRRISSRASHVHQAASAGCRHHVWRRRSVLAYGPRRRARTNDVMTEIVATARRRGWVPPPRGFWSLEPEAFGIAAQPATITVDVAAWVPCKLAAILCHRSQMIEGHPFAQLCDAD